MKVILEQKMEEISKTMHTHCQTIAQHATELDEKYQNAFRALSELGDALTAIIKEEGEPSEMYVKIHVSKVSGTINIKRTSPLTTDLMEIHVEEVISHSSALKAFVEMWNCGKIRSSWHNLSSDEKDETKLEFMRICSERAIIDDNDKYGMKYKCTLDSDNDIVATETL